MTPVPPAFPNDPARAAAGSGVADLFRARAAATPDAPALTWADGERTYGAVLQRVQRLAGLLAEHGVGPGDRVALLSRNHPDYLEAVLACAWLGAVAACQNWRLSADELAWCLDLVEPALILAGPDQLDRLADREEPRLPLGPTLQPALDAASPRPAPRRLDPETALLVLYTSGTTGRPKGAVISHRALVARNLVLRAEYGLAPTADFAAWSPMYHMGGLEYSLATLISGGAVHVVDGFDADALAGLVETRRLGWLLLMPGMVGRFADLLESRGHEPGGARLPGVQVCGVMADLVPRADLARITRLLDAPYANTFGATETGNPPASAGLLPVGHAPAELPKTPSPHCELRLVDEAGRDVPDGQPGELLMRGPTLFSGYWGDPDATAEAFAGGWFHMGDVFVRHPDGRLSFVDRRKYLIKSGGENIYPAEIERVLLADPGVAEAAVVRRPDPTWGEVPVAFVARTGSGVTAEGLIEACRAALASYKRPKEVVFIDLDDFPRSASGKVRRQDLEARLAAASPPPSSQQQGTP